MAQRPIFLPKPEGRPFIAEISLDFEWYPGFSATQAQKSIQSLHSAATKQGLSPVLEISSKSPEALGVALSAFNLRLQLEDGRTLPVECAFQGSKVFRNGGPYTDLYSKSSRDAKTDQRLRASGDLIAFNLAGDDFSITPVTAFYDWLFLRALQRNRVLADQLLQYKAFSDIVFNQEKSVNCQARSAALFVALTRNSGIDVEKAAEDRHYFLGLMTGKETRGPSQLPLL